MATRCGVCRGRGYTVVRVKRDNVYYATEVSCGYCVGGLVR